MAQVKTSLADCLDDVLELRPFPVAASKLISECDKSDSTAKQLSEIIKLDPALSLKLLQMANSPIYGFAGEIRSVDHAAVVLGMRALRDMAISVSVCDAFDSGSAASTTARKELWLHSLACGVVSRSLGLAIKIESPDEAFLGGIVHDVGKLFFFDHSPDEYIQATSISERSKLVSIENETFGIDHPNVGERCGQYWGLPDEINDVICFHHNPDDSDFDAELIKVVAAANQLCRVWTAGEKEDPLPLTTHILDSHGFAITSDEITTLHQEATQEVACVFEAYGK